MERRGLTLLEVLFSIFVLAIGVISILSLIPVAKSQIRDAGDSDRASSAAMNALADIRARGWLANCRSEPWTDQNGDGVFILADDTYTDVNGNGAFDDWPYGVVIDPLFLSANYPAPEVLSFPYQLDGAPYGVTPVMRTTPWPGMWGNANHEPLADKLFRSPDDIVWATPDGDGQRPIPTSNTGQFSWLATAVPSDATQRPESYTVSVAVFRGRERVLPIDQPLPGERMAWCDVVGSGLGGGDVRLRAVGGTNEDWLKVRPNQWVLVIGWQAGGALVPSVTTPDGTGRNRLMMKWLRVAGASNQQTETIGGTDWLVSYATLAGPDLIARDRFDVVHNGMAIDNDTTDTVNGVADRGTPDAAYDADGDAATGNTFQVVLFDNCIGVFERVIRND